MAQMIASFNRSRKVAEATSPTDEPTPIYLLKELQDATFESSEASSQLAEALVKRIASKNPNIMAKALRAMKELCLKGHPDFRKYLQRNAGPVRECSVFRSDPDPLRGERPAQMVREAAKEAIEVIFSSAVAPKASATAALGSQNSTGRKMQGFGSSSGTGGAMGTGNGNAISSSSQPPPGSKYTGFGNPNMKQPSTNKGATSYFSAQTWIEGAHEAMNAATQLVNNYQSSGQQKATPFLRDPSDQYHAPLELPDTSTSYSGVSAPAQSLHVESVAIHSAPPIISSSSAASQGNRQGGDSPELRLVDNMCNAGGVRVQPRLEDLSRFVSVSSSMDIQVIGRLLIAQIEAGSWQASLRALCCLEAMLESSAPQPCQDAIRNQLSKDIEVVKVATRSPQGSVAKRAESVLSVLNPAGRPANVVGAPISAGQNDAGNFIEFDEPSISARPQASVDLISGLMDTIPSESNGRSEGVTAVGNGGSGLFAGMLLGAEGNAPQTDTKQPQTRAATDGMDSMFAGLKIGSTDAPSLEPVSANTKPPGSHLPGANGELAELFGGASINMTGHMPAQAPNFAPVPGQAPTFANQNPGFMPMGVPPMMQGSMHSAPGLMSYGMMMPQHGVQQGMPANMMMGAMPGYPQQGMAGMMPMQQPQMWHVQPGMMYPQQQMPSNPTHFGAGMQPPLPGSHRTAAPDIFHPTGAWKTADSYSKAFPAKNEPAFDFIGEHIKTSK